MINENPESYEVSPELKDIHEMIKRYNAANPDSIFLYSFVGFKKDAFNECPECGEDEDIVRDETTSVGAFGEIHILRDMLNHLRDTIEDDKDDEGYVNF